MNVRNDRLIQKPPKEKIPGRKIIQSISYRQISLWSFVRICSILLFICERQVRSQEGSQKAYRRALSGLRHFGYAGRKSRL